MFPRPPDRTGNQRQACRQRLPAAPLPARQPHSLGSRSVFDALRHPSSRSGPNPVTATSLDLWRPARPGFLHGHGTEVVCAAPESTEIVTKAVRVGVGVCVSIHGTRPRVRGQSPAPHDPCACAGGHGSHWRHRLPSSLAPGCACAACPAPGRRVDVLFLPRGLGRKSPPPPVSVCVHRPRPAQLLACPSLDPVPTARTGSAPHIRLCHQPGDLWSLSPVARESF